MALHDLTNIERGYVSTFPGIYVSGHDFLEEGDEVAIRFVVDSTERYSDGRCFYARLKHADAKPTRTWRQRISELMERVTW